MYEFIFTAPLNRVGPNTNSPISPQLRGAGRYTPPKLSKIEKQAIWGNADMATLKTSIAERQKLNMRMSMRRFTRLTNGFSKTYLNHCAAVALYASHYNMVRVHEALRIARAMPLGVTDHVWTIGELVEAALNGVVTDEPQDRKVERFTVIRGGKGMRVRIEPYRISDRPTVKSFVEAIQAFEARSVTGLRAAHEIGEPYTRQILRMVETNRGTILLAREGSKSVGFVCAWINSDQDMLLSEKMREFAYVSDVFVRPAWRRKGVGRQLLKAVEAEMKDKGCARIRICSKAANSVALGAYAKAGYKPYEVTLTKRLSDRF